MAQVRNLLGILARRQGRLRDSRRHLEMSARLAELLRDPGARVAALNNLALVAADDGDLEDALNRARAALDLATRHGDRHHVAALHNNLSDLFYRLGDDDQAMAH